MSGSKPTSDESRKIVEAFGNLLVDRLKNRTTEFGQAYVRLLFEVVLSSAEVRIAGSVKALEHAASGPLAKLATIVPIFVRGVVRDAVRSEPVSACSSLLTGKKHEFAPKTGDLIEFDALAARDFAAGTDG